MDCFTLYEEYLSVTEKPGRTQSTRQSLKLSRHAVIVIMVRRAAYAMADSFQ